MSRRLNADIFQKAGFSITEQSSKCIKAVKGHCEIYIKQEPTATVLELPVIELFGRRDKSQPLMCYLLERNGAMNGPGFFAIIDGCIYYRSIVYCSENISEVALKMQETIEQLGPKIINVAKQ